MSACRLLVTPLVAAFLAVGGGCQWVPKSQFTACEIQSREMVERNKALLAENQNLQTHNRELAAEVVQHEEDLAALEEQLGLNDRRLSNFQRERDELHRQFAGMARGAGGLGSRYTEKLAELSSRYPILKFDAETGLSKLDIDVLFDTGETRLKPESRKLLEEFAALMNSPAGRELRVMVVGHSDDRAVAGREVRARYPNNWHLSSARAVAVADLLQHNGVEGARLGVAGFGRHQPVAENRSAEERQRNRRVEIFVMAPDVPVVGWADTMTGLY